MAHDVFISHSVKDKVTADAVCAVLESEGVRCWIAPRDVMPGMEWGECIIEAIEQTRVMVLVFTADANASPQIRREVERAVNHGVAILPVRIEDVMPGRALEYFIGNVHWLDALTPPLEAHLKNLAGTVKMLLARLDQNPPPMPHAAAGGMLQAAKPPEPAVVPTAEPAMLHPPENGHDESGFRGVGADEKPFEIGKAASLNTQAGSRTRTFGEWQSGGGTVAKGAPLLRIPVWAWGGAGSVLLLIAVLAVVHFTSRPTPAASPQPAAPPAVAPNPASAPSPAGAPVGPAPVPKTGPAKTASPVAPGPSVAAKPAAKSPGANAANAALLRETMGELQHELSSIGTVSFTVSTKEGGNTSRDTFDEQVSNVVAEPNQCRISYRIMNGSNGVAFDTKNPRILLRDVTSVVIEPLSHKIPWGVVDPPTVTQLLMHGLPDFSFNFTDVALANHTAATLKQAVKLCGGSIAN
jgi:hypothetical protein